MVPPLPKKSVEKDLLLALVLGSVGFTGYSVIAVLIGLEVAFTLFGNFFFDFAQTGLLALARLHDIFVVLALRVLSLRVGSLQGALVKGSLDGAHVFDQPPTSGFLLGLGIVC